VTPPDPESPVRVCLTNDEEHGLRFGWQGKSSVYTDETTGKLTFEGYWCYVGDQVPLELEEKPDEALTR
jgi:hypothetical protein